MNKTFTKGEIIFREGDKGESFFEVLKGFVGVYTGYGTASEQKLTEIGAGHIVGELALIDDFPRSATVVALEDCELTEVTIDEVRAYFEGSPDKIKFILGELGERLQRLTDDYTDACVTIRELYPVNNEARKPGIADKIKKFVEAYKLVDKSKQPSTSYFSAEQCHLAKELICIESCKALLIRCSIASKDTYSTKVNIVHALSRLTLSKDNCSLAVLFNL